MMVQRKNRSLAVAALMKLMKMEMERLSLMCSRL
jgi:hypothetical protein